MVQEIPAIGKCERSDAGLGFVLLGVQKNLQTTPSGNKYSSNLQDHSNKPISGTGSLRSVPNVAQLPCRTKFKHLIRLKHDSSTTFEAI